EQDNTFDADVDEPPTMFMANLSSVDLIYNEAGPLYDSDTLSEVQDHDNYLDNVLVYHEVQEMQNDVQQSYVVPQMLNIRVIVILVHMNKTIVCKTDILVFRSETNFNKLKEQLQRKDNTIRTLKEKISHMTERCSEADRSLDVKALISQNKELIENVTTLQEQNEPFRAENEKVKQHYKELYDSIKIMRAKTIKKTSSLLTENEKLKAWLKGKMECVTMNTVKPKVLAPGFSKHMMGNHSRLKDFIKKFIGTVRFRNDHFGAIMGYEDYVIGDSVIFRRDLPRDNPLVNVEVLRYNIKRSKSENKGIVPTDVELVLEQTQQVTLENPYPMDDERMWDADCVVALTLGSAVTIPETANEFAIKGNAPNGHGHNLSKGDIIIIFYHGLNEITQEVLNAAASGSSNSDTEKIMARIDAMTLKMDAQYKELQTHAKKTKPNLNEDDIPMSREEEAKFMQTFPDLGAIINLMSYSLYAKLSLETLKPTKMSVRLADRSFQYPIGIAENMLVEVVIQVKQKQLNLGVGTERIIFNIDSAMKHSYSNDDKCFSINVIDEILEEDFDALLDEGSKILHSIERTLLEEEIFAEFDEFMAMIADINSDSESDTKDPPFEKITINIDYKIKTSLEEPPTNLKLKPLPDNLEYVFLEEPFFFLPWVSHIQCVPKKYGITVVINEDDELVPTRTVMGWRLGKMSLHGQRRIVLGHKVSNTGLEVDKAKIDVISKLPPPTNIKGIKSFLGHASFYRRFIKDFSKIARPLTKLLEKDTQFEFDDECQKALEFLKEKLTCAPVIVNPNWNLPFKLMCDASDFVVEPSYVKKMAFRTAYKTPTETTPYKLKLIYGKNCHLPFEMEHRAYWALKNCNPDLIAAAMKNDDGNLKEMRLVDVICNQRNAKRDLKLQWHAVRSNEECEMGKKGCLAKHPSNGSGSVGSIRRIQSMDTAYPFYGYGVSISAVSDGDEENDDEATLTEGHNGKHCNRGRKE
nr:reverse transcriptase domain-containing protein [Tanacetum cinerariifolium]